MANSKRAGESRRKPPQIPVSSRPGNGLVREEIAKRAYTIFEQRGCVDGHDQEDWYEAEKQLIRELRQEAG